MQELRVYRPNKDKNGAATRFQLSLKKRDKYDEYLVFFESTKQTGEDANGNASFGWKDDTKRITMKMEPIDIGEVLLVLSGKKTSLGTKGTLYHQNDKGNTVLVLDRKENGFFYKISSQKDKEVLVIQHMISFAEGQILQVLLGKALTTIFGW